MVAVLFATIVTRGWGLCPLDPHMLDHAGEAVAMARGRTCGDLDKARQLTRISILS